MNDDILSYDDWINFLNIIKPEINSFFVYEVKNIINVFVDKFKQNGGTIITSNERDLVYILINRLCCTCVLPYIKLIEKKIENNITIEEIFGHIKCYKILYPICINSQKEIIFELYEYPFKKYGLINENVLKKLDIIKNKLLKKFPYTKDDDDMEFPFLVDDIKSITSPSECKKYLDKFALNKLINYSAINKDNLDIVKNLL